MAAPVTITVHAVAPSGAPSVSITSPPDTSHYCAGHQDAAGDWYATVVFTAPASDPGNPPQSLTYAWTDSITGAAPTQVSNQLSLTINLYYVMVGSPGQHPPTTHDLALTATHTFGKASSAYIHISISWPCIG